MFPEHPLRLTVQVTFPPVSLKYRVESFSSFEALNPEKSMPLRVMVWGALVPNSMACVAVAPIVMAQLSKLPAGLSASFQTSAEVSAAPVYPDMLLPVKTAPATAIWPLLVITLLIQVTAESRVIAPPRSTFTPVSEADVDPAKFRTTVWGEAADNAPWL